MGGGQGQSVKPSNCFRHLEKLLLHFWHKSFILHDVELAELSNDSFEWKKCDILVGGGKTYYDPSYIFSGGHDPQPPMIYAAETHFTFRIHNHMKTSVTVENHHICFIYKITGSHIIRSTW